MIGAIKRQTLLTGVLAASALISANAALGAECGDVDNNGRIAASDALLVLQKGVGIEVDLSCDVAGPGNFEYEPFSLYAHEGIDCDTSGTDVIFTVPADRRLVLTDVVTLRGGVHVNGDGVTKAGFDFGTSAEVLQPWSSKTGVPFGPDEEVTLYCTARASATTLSGRLYAADSSQIKFKTATPPEPFSFYGTPGNDCDNSETSAIFTVPEGKVLIIREIHRLSGTVELRENDATRLRTDFGTNNGSSATVTLETGLHFAAESVVGLRCNEGPGRIMLTGELKDQD